MALDLFSDRKQLDSQIDHLSDELRILQSVLVCQAVDRLLLGWRKFDVEISARLALIQGGLIVDLNAVDSVLREKGLLLTIGHALAPTALSCYKSANGWCIRDYGSPLIGGIGFDPAESLGASPGFLLSSLLLFLCLGKKLFDLQSQLVGHGRHDLGILPGSPDGLIDHRWRPAIDEFFDPDLVKLKQCPPDRSRRIVEPFEALKCGLISQIDRFVSAP